MTRIETALQRMRDEAQVMVWLGDLTKMAATPTGQALGALVEAAEAERIAELVVDEGGGIRSTWRAVGEAKIARQKAVDAFRAATEPRP